MVRPETDSEVVSCSQLPNALDLDGLVQDPASHCGLGKTNNLSYKISYAQVESLPTLSPRPLYIMDSIYGLAPSPYFFFVLKDHDLFLTRE